MSYHGYQGQTGHHEPYPPYPDQWATHPNTYGLPSWDHTYGYHQRATHGLVSEIPRTLAADNGVGNAVAVDCISLMTLTSLAFICSPGQYGESAWSSAPLATAEYEARRYGHLQGVSVATIPVYGADPYTPHQTMAHCGTWDLRAIRL